MSSPTRSPHASLSMRAPRSSSSHDECETTTGLLACTHRCRLPESDWRRSIDIGSDSLHGLVQCVFGCRSRGQLGACVKAKLEDKRQPLLFAPEKIAEQVIRLSGQRDSKREPPVGLKPI